MMAPPGKPGKQIENFNIYLEAQNNIFTIRF